MVSAREVIWREFNEDWPATITVQHGKYLIEERRYVPERTCHIIATFLGKPPVTELFESGDDGIVTDERFIKLLNKLKGDVFTGCSACHREISNGVDLKFEQHDDGSWHVSVGGSLIQFCPNCGARVEQ